MTMPLDGTDGPPEQGPALDPGGPSPSTLQRIARGDLAAVGQCIDRHGPLVWSLARRSCPNATDAEDLVQDVFIELWKSASRYDPGVASEATFVAMIARRRLIDRGRRLRSRPMPGPLPEGLAAAPAAEILEQAEDVARAAEALGGLRDEQRRVLTLSLRDGLTYDQIARATGQPLGTVKTHARRGLIRLRELMLGLAGGPKPAETPGPARGAGRP